MTPYGKNRVHLSKKILLKKNFNVNLSQAAPMGVVIKRCSENMQQIYRKTPMPKCVFDKVVLQIYSNHTSA